MNTAVSDLVSRISEGVATYASKNRLTSDDICVAVNEITHDCISNMVVVPIESGPEIADIRELEKSIRDAIPASIRSFVMLSLRASDTSPCIVRVYLNPTETKPSHVTKVPFVPPVVYHPHAKSPRGCIYRCCCFGCKCAFISTVIIATTMGAISVYAAYATDTHF